MISREYYSLVEAAGILHGEGGDWPNYQFIIRDLIHESANERLGQIVLLSGKQGKLHINGEPSQREFINVTDSYGFVPAKLMASFEATCASFPLDLQNATMPLFVVHGHDNNPDSCWELKEDSPIILSINTLHILTNDLRAYLAQKGLTDNTISQLPPYLDPTHPLHSKELKIAIDAWMAVLASNPEKPKGKTRKSLLTDWIKKNSSHKEGSNSFKRIIEIINPDKAGTGKTSED